MAIHGVDIAVVVTCTLSIVGSLFIIISFLLFKDFQNSMSRRLLVILSICDLLTAVAYLIHVGKEPEHVSHREKVRCEVQSAVNIFANQASFFWTDFIALFVLLSRKYGMKYASKFIPFFHAISWGWPIVSVILVGSYGVWGYDNGDATADWCWIRGGAPLYWHIVAGKGIEWASYLIVTVIYIGVFMDLRRTADQQLLLTHRSGPTWKMTEKKLLAIPIIFIILRLPGTIRTIYMMKNPTGTGVEGVWIYLQAIGDSGQGFANGLLFGVFTEKVRSYYYKLIGRCTRRYYDDDRKVNETAPVYAKVNISQNYF
eukprot:Phypoly_transcript_11920.p1 GENE.Phypoly_transcript_11920~~Phypoly_transcript_11920.p1  ORF type:complete len:314 (+),score=17.49 Phypoly_transcript_11920:79-1020(+)